ncbi:MAG: PEP-CTERM sorting domain-containing protein [Rubrivivax sp.]|nr:MAG: PEP-CTERM sorting domain-containing protein [Rubrivivax sp.]
MKLFTSLVQWALFGAALVPGAAAAATSLDTYVLTAAGNSMFGAGSGPFSCSTFAPDAGAALFGRTYQLSLPTDGSICGVGGDTRTVHGTAGTVQAVATLGVGFGPSTDPRTFTGNAKARAGYGDLGVQAVAAYTGTSDSSLVVGSQAGARQVDALTFHGGTGAGIYRASVTVDGSLFGVGRTDSEIEFGYWVGTGPTRMAFRITNSRGVVSLYANGGFQSALPGMTTTGALAEGFTVAGATTFSFDIPIVFGEAQDIGFSLWAAHLPSSNVGLLTPSGGDASFFSSAKLTGIEVFDSSGHAVPGFSVTSSSGTLYGAGGVTAVPEPATALMWGAGGLLLFARRRRT